MIPFVVHLSGSGWERSEAPHRMALDGGVFLDNDLVGMDDLRDFLDKGKRSDELAVYLNRCNGFYRWVMNDQTHLLAGVDAVRSRPLFYALHGGRLFLSDQAEWVRFQAGQVAMDSSAKEEFLLAGYVTGSDTLYGCVKQLQAGEYLTAEMTSSGIAMHAKRYYRFTHNEPTNFSEPELRESLRLATRNSMERLIKYAAGREIVVPLSGGYDSRLIASQLRLLRYPHVKCFSYGVRGNKEAEMSRRIAQALGLEWRFVEYSPDLWRTRLAEPDAERYRQLASNHCSLPHWQDWPAIADLTEHGHITNDAVVVPGHSGDFVAGSHIPDFVFSLQSVEKKELVDYIRATHLSNMPWNRVAHFTSRSLADRIESRTASDFDGTAVDAAAYIELWDWQERQAKYIVNSVRVYDSFGLDWWLPLWDLEFVRFWQHVPLSLRRRRHWYKNWVSGQYRIAGDPLSSDSRIERNASDNFLNHPKVRAFAALLPLPVFESLRARRRRAQASLLNEGLADQDELAKYLALGYSLIGVLSDLHIKNEYR